MREIIYTSITLFYDLSRQIWKNYKSSVLWYFRWTPHWTTYVLSAYDDVIARHHTTRLLGFILVNLYYIIVIFMLNIMICVKLKPNIIAARCYKVLYNVMWGITASNFRFLRVIIYIIYIIYSTHYY